MKAHDSLFQVVREYVLSGGGDGDGWVICPNPRDMADEFAQYEARQDNAWFTQRRKNDFFHEQECVHFVPVGTQLPTFGGEIIVEVYA